MTLVVSDTTPLNYLILIGLESVLPALYGEILVPSQVMEELQHPGTPEKVAQWASAVPDWIIIRKGDSSLFPSLDSGEAAALELAISGGARLLVDEVQARQMALAQGVPTIGTVGILAEAHIKGLVSFDEAVAALQMTSFRIRPGVISAIRKRLSEDI